MDESISNKPILRTGTDLSHFSQQKLEKNHSDMFGSYLFNFIPPSLNTQKSLCWMRQGVYLSCKNDNLIQVTRKCLITRASMKLLRLRIHIDRVKYFLLTQLDSSGSTVIIYTLAQIDLNLCLHI